MKLLRRIEPIEVMLIVAVVAFAAMEPRFARLENIENILNQASVLMILASGQMLVLMVRGFDLAIGEIISVTSVLTALALVSIGNGGLDNALQINTVALLIALSIGIAAGALNGALIGWFKLSPFIVTLGAMSILKAISSTASDGFPVPNVPQSFINMYDGAWAGPVSPSIVIAGVFLMLLHFFLKNTVLGVGISFTGENESAGRIAGLTTRFYHVLPYMICSVCGAFAALLLTARTGSGEPMLGGGLMLQSIAAAIIGGTSVRGGKGSVRYPIYGALLITVLSNGMNLSEINRYLQTILVGVILIAAVALDQWKARRGITG